MIYSQMDKIAHEDSTIEDEEIRYQCANRVFTLTCIKLTLQNKQIQKEIDKQQGEYMNKNRKRKENQLYSFLENWYLHSMFNKSQKVLLGISDTKPCVILSMDDFMFTPPPILPTQPELYHGKMDLIGMEEYGEDGVFSNITFDVTPTINHNQHDSNFIDENTWMITNSSSILDVIGENENNNNNEEEDEEDDEILSISDSKQLGIITNHISWYKSNENVCSHNLNTPVNKSDINYHENQYTTHKQQKQTVSWIQKIQDGIIFISKRLIETAYLVSEVTESFTNKKVYNGTINATDHLINGQHYGTINNYYNSHSIAGKCIILMLRMCRIFFLGVEVVLNQFSNTNSSVDGHCILPTLLSAPNAFN
ncbi:unnamed protein product [Cunninghamella blakesleeana]